MFLKLSESFHFLFGEKCARINIELICLLDKSCAFEMELNYLMSWGLSRKIKQLVDFQFGKNVWYQKTDSLSLLRKKIKALKAVVFLGNRKCDVKIHLSASQS